MPDHRHSSDGWVLFGGRSACCVASPKCPPILAWRRARPGHPCRGFRSLRGRRARSSSSAEGENLTRLVEGRLGREYRLHCKRGSHGLWEARRECRRSVRRRGVRWQRGRSSCSLRFWALSVRYRQQAFCFPLSPGRAGRPAILLGCDGSSHWGASFRDSRCFVLFGTRKGSRMSEILQFVHKDKRGSTLEEVLDRADGGGACYTQLQPMCLGPSRPA